MRNKQGNHQILSCLRENERKKFDKYINHSVIYEPHFNTLATHETTNSVLKRNAIQNRVDKSSN